MEEAKVGVRCEYCGDSVVEAEIVWHLENKHDKVGQTKISVSGDMNLEKWAKILGKSKLYEKHNNG